MLKQGVLTGLVALAVTVGSERASADLYRCQLPDGKLVFTDREETCPGVESHKIDAEIQFYERSPAAIAPAPQKAPSPLGGPTSDPQRDVWRGKKLRAEKELGSLEEKWDYLNQYITHCNRHRKILGQKASGLPYEVSCKNIRQEHSQVKLRLQEVRLFLD